MKRGKKDSKVSNELKNQLARALADYDNLSKRVEKEREELIKVASISLFAKLMSVFDMLAQAQKHIKDPGLEQVNNELRKVLQEEGIVEIEAKAGDKFDENVHEAIEVVVRTAAGKNKKVVSQEGKIANLELEGWRVEDGPVIRPAKVKVFK